MYQNCYSHYHFCYSHSFFEKQQKQTKVLICTFSPPFTFHLPLLFSPPSPLFHVFFFHFLYTHCNFQPRIQLNHTSIVIFFVLKNNTHYIIGLITQRNHTSFMLTHNGFMMLLYSGDESKITKQNMISLYYLEVKSNNTTKL